MQIPDNVTFYLAPSAGYLPSRIFHLTINILHSTNLLLVLLNVAECWSNSNGGASSLFVIACHNHQHYSTFALHQHRKHKQIQIDRFYHQFWLHYRLVLGPTRQVFGVYFLIMRYPFIQMSLKTGWSILFQQDNHDCSRNNDHQYLFPPSLSSVL